ncbi:ion transporter [Aestuariivirga sp.]|uniref:ion transporter n=1 Tax=Aestuariivirga sp. TaxID=2650926 RepID=UPI0039E4FC0D
MLEKLRPIFTDPHVRGYRIWHDVVMGFIFFSCAALVLESVQSYQDAYAVWFDWAEWISVAFFTVDAAANIAFAPNPWRYLFSFWGFIDLISVLPSYLMLFNLTAVRSTKVIRLLRVARALRVLKLARAAADQAEGAERHETNPLAANLKIYCIVFFATLMLSSTAMYFVEGHLYDADVMQAEQQAINAATPAGQTPATYMPTDPLTGDPIPEDKRFYTSIPAAMWWSITTMTTTGYGDMFPVTVGGRMVAAVTMLLGLILFAILLNLINKTMLILLFGEKHGIE